MASHFLWIEEVSTTSLFSVTCLLSEVRSWWLIGGVWHSNTCNLATLISKDSVFKYSPTLLQVTTNQPVWEQQKLAWCLQQMQTMDIKDFYISGLNFPSTSTSVCTEIPHSHLTHLLSQPKTEVFNNLLPLGYQVWSFTLFPLISLRFNNYLAIYQGWLG